MDGQELIRRLTGWDASVAPREKADRPAVVVPPEKLRDLMALLRDDPDLAFDLLLDHTAIDWIEQGRFELVYHLYSTTHGHYLLVTAAVPRDNPVVPTVGDIWPVAHWQEREVFDLFGVLYDDHPDLRRLFLDDDWQGHPLRKDYRDPDMLELPK